MNFNAFKVLKKVTLFGKVKCQKDETLNSWLV